MATPETRQLDGIIASRRTLLTAGGAAIAGLALSAFPGDAQAQSTVTDTDILNFALNLEYLEAQFYSIAASGVTADSSLLPNPISTGGGPAPLTKGPGTKGVFAIPQVQAYALEIAFEERNHVAFLRNALGTGAVAQPQLDLVNSFKTLGTALTPSQPAFDPFSSDAAFLLGAYIFEDVGVSAYHGAAALIADKLNVLGPAAAIHATEAYHAGIIRATLYTLDPNNSNGYLTLASSISNVRATLDGTASASTGPDDIGLTVKTVALEGASTYPATTQINADTNYLCWSRTTSQVLKIVYANSSGTKGGFFPNGLNGTIS